ncbi:hypothetical protein KMZ32_01810 [Phycicoccus sp. MAQZ13P-2]|uniref:hypothetical protein n=1 Tax=Phycicoccus mangrovi TaxID=2840470 RepID=UPI001C0002F5|nr:hypothetical protein [Phycicoccus mangrovi]MBT9254428.1 hypothetical protein [Phycicoccus mangrovi]MBT9272806.1 hypothetical protein [Phycicoccus mangrovi]
MAIGAAGALYLWWSAWPLRSGSSWTPQVAVVAMLVGPALVVAAFAGLVQVFLHRAGGTVLVTIATSAVVLVSGCTCAVLGALVIDSGWMPGEVTLRPTGADLTTALSIWGLFTVGLVTIGVLGLRSAKASSSAA